LVRDDDNEDKRKVIEFFQNRGLEVIPIPKVQDRKTPDFEVRLNNNIFAYCELKSIKQYNWSGVRCDPNYNRIQNKIHEACKQLMGINPNHSIPNIVIILNHDRCCNLGHLNAVLKGKISTAKGEVNFDTRYRNRLLKKDDLINIDLIIWLESNSSKTYHISESIFKDQLKKYFS